MASISNDKFQWHGEGSGYGSENSPKIYLHYVVTSGDIIGEGSSRSVPLTYEVGLNALSGTATFGFPIRVFIEKPNDPTGGDYSLSEDYRLFTKPYSDSQWGSDTYKGSKTKSVSINDVNEDGTYDVNLYIATYYYTVTNSDGCGCGKEASKGQTATQLGSIQLFTPGAPEVPASCSVSKTEVLVGGSFVCTYSGNRCQYRTRNASGVWGSWVDWNETSGSTFTIASDYSVSAVQMRSYNVDQSYMISESDFVESSVVYSKLPSPTKPAISPSPVLFGNSVTATSTHVNSRCTINYEWFDSANLTVGLGHSFPPPSSGHYCKAFVTKSYFVKSDYSPSSGEIRVKLNSPASLVLMQVPMYNMKLSDFTKSINATEINPEGLTVVWQYSIDESSWTDWSGSHKVTSPYIYVRVKYTKSGYVESDWTSDISGNTKLNAPVSVTVGQPMYNSLLSDLSKSISPPTAGNPSDSSTEWQYSTGSSGSWISWNDSHKIVSPYVYLQARYTKSGFVSSDWISGTSGNTKLNKPSSLSASPSPVTVELPVTVTAVADADAVVNYFWYKSDGSQISGQSGSTYITNYTDGSGVYAKAQATRPGYVSSDLSDASSPVVVYFEPRSMSSNGFKVTFNTSSLVTPGTSLFSSWNDFKPLLNLGRFNHYVLELLSSRDGSWVLEESVSGGNIPTSTSVDSYAIEVGPDLAGLSCKLRLSCYYKSGDSVVGPQTTAQFESDEFIVGGYPLQPEFIYPGVRDFKTCNLTPRLIFKVSNPDNLPDTNIYDIRVVVKTNSGDVIYTFKDNSDMFFDKNGSIVVDVIPNETFVVFKLPSSSDIRTVQVYCKNAYLEVLSPSVVVCTYVTSSYPAKGTILSNKNHREEIYSKVREVVEGYRKINGDKGLVSLESSNYPPVVKSFCIPILNLLKTTHDAILQYAPRQAADIRIEGIDTSTEQPFVVTNTESFGTTLGNFFSDIYYILKNML